jgi:hypothetical protein
MTSLCIIEFEMKITFRGEQYKVIFSEHAKIQMELRDLSEDMIVEVIETGTVKEKDVKNKFWVYKPIKGRKDNLISVALAIESPHLIIVTAMVNWRPK